MQVLKLLIFFIISIHLHAQPNIVFIMFDDAELYDFGVYGGLIDTPNLDELAKSGMVFNQARSNTVCTPSRAELLTGKYSPTVGLSELSNGISNHPNQLGYLNTNVEVLPEFLQKNGYATGMFGKWHLGLNSTAPSFWDSPPLKGHEPRDRGFDEFSGVLVGTSSHYGDDNYYEDGLPMTEFSYDFYSSDFFGDKAVEFISNNSTKLFIYLPFTAPHAPLQAPIDSILYNKYYEKYVALSSLDTICLMHYDALYERGFSEVQAPFALVGTTGSKRSYLDNIDRLAKHAAMIEQTDFNVGKVMDALKAKGIYDDTLIIATSDNGGDGNSSSYIYNCPMRGFKGSILEGGIHVPMIISYKNKIQQGTRTNQLLHFIDMKPTIEDILKEYIGDTISSNMDGISIKNTLYYQQEIPRELFISSGFNDQCMLIDNDLNKLKADKSDNFDNPQLSLYSLKCDPYEQQDISNEDPELLASLKARLDQFVKKVNVVPSDTIDYYIDNYPLVASAIVLDESICVPKIPILSDVAHDDYCTYGYLYCNYHPGNQKEFELHNLSTGSIEYFITIDHFQYVTLIPNNDYQYKVRTQCGTTGIFGGWSDYLSFSSCLP